jgi:hypothetical protein
MSGLNPSLDLEAGPALPGSSGDQLLSRWVQLLALILAGPKTVAYEMWRRIKLEIVVEVRELNFADIRAGQSSSA